MAGELQQVLCKILSTSRYRKQLSQPIIFIFKMPWDYANEISKSWLYNYNKYFAKYSPPLDLKSNYLNPFYLFFRPEMYAPIATGESARRYFSWLYYPYMTPMHGITPNFVQ